MKNFFKTQVFNDEYETADRLAMDFIRYAESTLKYREKIYIALSGGSTPQTMFKIIAQEYPKSLPWNQLHFFWVDERCVPHASSESNFGNAERIMFSKLEINRENIHPACGGDDPEGDVVRYTGEILANVPCNNNYPVFDLIFLGMGTDGHTASIFPGQQNLFQIPAICALNEHPETHQKRITLTGKVINNSLDVVFLVTGESKAPIVKDIFSDSEKSKTYPAKSVRPFKGKLSWYLDKNAAKFIDL